MTIKHSLAFALLFFCHNNGCHSVSTWVPRIGGGISKTEGPLYTHPSEQDMNEVDTLKVNIASDSSPHNDAALHESGSLLITQPSTGVSQGISAMVKMQTGLPVLARPRSDSHGHRDMFICGSCLCTYNNHRLVDANCTFRKLTALLDTFPMQTIGVNISHNILSAFNQSQITSIKSLQTLDISYNAISTFIVGNTTKTNTLQKIDLSHNRIKEVKSGCFLFAPMLEYLYLQRNEISHIYNNTFLVLAKLKVLDLSVNKILRIEGAAFDSLVNLNELYLYSNQNLGYTEKHLPPALFKNVKKLRKLWIQGSRGYTAKNYPINALKQIHLLDDLNIDILNSPVFLGPPILNLTRLTTIAFGPRGNCYHIKNIPSTFFKYVPNITSLSFDHCLFHGMDSMVYSSLPRLTELSIRYIKTYSLEQAFQDLRGMNNITMLKRLRFEHLSGIDTPCFSLSANHAKFLTRLPLTDIDLSHNRIALVRDDFLQGLPPTLKVLVLRGNVLTTKDHLLHRLTPLKNLVELDVSFQNMDERALIPMTSKNDKSNTLSSDSAETGIIEKNVHDTRWTTASIHVAQENNRNESITKTIKEVNDARAGNFLNSKSIRFPIHFKVLRASHFNFFGDMLFNRNIETRSLQVIDVSNSLTPMCGRGHMPSSVRHADLSGTYCHHFQFSFFEPNNSLNHLSLKTNFLGPQFAIEDGRTYFTHLSQAFFLDLSMNAIYHLPYNFLKGLYSLQTLRMTDNRLRHFNTSLRETPNLKMLDLRRNSVSRIPRKIRDELDEMASKHPVTLALLHNPISCSCGNIDMIKWLSMTKVYLLDKEMLECLNEHGHIQVMRDIELLHTTLQSQCTDLSNIIITTTVCVVLFLVTVVGYYTGKRYRWWFYVKYKKNVWIARWFGFKPKIPTGYSEETYKYDAFLLYCDKDRDLAYDCVDKLHRHHRLFVPDQDILFGTSEVGGIISGITNSYTFLIVMSENFKEQIRTGFKNSGMLEYTINMALCEEMVNKRSFLHVLLFSDLEDFKMPLYLANVLQDHKRQTTFPMGGYAHTTPEAIGLVWDSLSACIRQTDTQGEYMLQEVTGGDRDILTLT